MSKARYDEVEVELLTSPVAVTLQVPKVYHLSQEDIEFIQRNLQLTAARGPGMEDEEACRLQIERNEGERLGAEKAAEFLLGEAGSLFAKGKDGEASRLRDAARKILDVLVPKLKAQKAEHEDLFVYSYRESMKKFWREAGLRASLSETQEIKPKP